MKKLFALGLIALLILGLAGCATGRAYDDSKVAMIKKNATTESELLEWFGPPNSRRLNGDGTKSMSWKFAAANAGSPHSAGHLEVYLNAEGKVGTYSASAGR